MQNVQPDAEMIYIIYDPTYSDSWGSYMCTACKVVEYYDSAHQAKFPHKSDCPMTNQILKTRASGFLVGPNQMPWYSKIDGFIEQAKSSSNSDSQQHEYGPVLFSEVFNSKQKA